MMACAWTEHMMHVPKCLQIIDFLEGVAKEHGHITGVANLIGNMCIKPAHLTSDEEVGLFINCM